MSVTGRKGVRETLSSTLHKCKHAMRKMTQEVLNKGEERSYGEEDAYVDGLFQNDGLRRSGESMTLADDSTDGRSVIETEDNGTDETKVSKQATARREDGRIPFEEYDTVSECAKLRRETGEPFYRADIIWLHRRGLWTQPTKTNSINESMERSRKFSEIPSKSYTKIYKKLSIDDRSLKEPLNLDNALKVIDAGWQEIKNAEQAAAANRLI